MKPTIEYLERGANLFLGFEDKIQASSAETGLLQFRPACRQRPDVEQCSTLLAVNTRKTTDGNSMAAASSRPGQLSLLMAHPLDRHQQPTSTFFQRSERRIDACLSLLLAIQAVTLFVVVPLSVHHPWGRSLLNLSHLAFTTICIAVLVRHRLVQGALVVAMALLVGAPLLQDRLSFLLGLTPMAFFEATACMAFAFNAIITVLVIRHVFGPGRVTAHKIQGAILLYLNVAALFSIAFAALSSAQPHSITLTGGTELPNEVAARIASLVYFSLTTITTSGFGDMIPVSPIARSLTNLEGVFGHLFPATLLARVVALHIAHENGTEGDTYHQSPAGAHKPPDSGCLYRF